MCVFPDLPGYLQVPVLPRRRSLEDSGLTTRPADTQPIRPSSRDDRACQDLQRTLCPRPRWPPRILSRRGYSETSSTWTKPFADHSRSLSVRSFCGSLLYCLTMCFSFLFLGSSKIRIFIRRYSLPSLCHLHDSCSSSHWHSCSSLGNLYEYLLREPVFRTCLLLSSLDLPRALTLTRFVRSNWSSMRSACFAFLSSISVTFLIIVSSTGPLTVSDFSIVFPYIHIIGVD